MCSSFTDLHYMLTVIPEKLLKALHSWMSGLICEWHRLFSGPIQVRRLSFLRYVCDFRRMREAHERIV